MQKGKLSKDSKRVCKLTYMQACCSKLFGVVAMMKISTLQGFVFDYTFAMMTTI